MEQKWFTYQAILLHMTKCTFVWSTNLVCGAFDKQDVCIIIVIPMITIIIIARRLIIYMGSPFLGDFFLNSLIFFYLVQSLKLNQNFEILTNILKLSCLSPIF